MSFGKLGAMGRGFGHLGSLGSVGVSLDTLSDDFSAASLSSNWTGVVGTDPQAVAARIVSGAVAITSGDTSPGTTAVDCSILVQSLRWKASHGNLSFEAKVKLDAITQVTAFVGFTDTLALERPGSVSGTTFTAVADNLAGFCFDTVSTPDTWFASGAKATVAQSTDTTIAPVANTYQTLKVTVDTSGTARYFVDGTLRATITNAVTANAALTPVLMVMERTVAAPRTLTADYITVQQTLMSVLQEEDGTPFLVDMNIDASRFYYNGTMYRTFAAMGTAMGVATDNADGTYTLGPNSNQPFSGYNTAAGTVVSEWKSTSQTLSLFVWTIQAASNANYWRRLTVNGTSQPEVSVNSGSAAQATFTFPASAERQTNYRFRAVDVMAGNDFSSHVNGELMGTDTSGVVSAAATSVSAQIWHRAGASKMIGTGYRWAYSPRAISTAQRRALSFLETNAVLAGGWTFFNDPRAIVVGGNVYVGAVEPQTGRFVVGKQGVAPVTLADLGEHDDHDNPAFLIRSSDSKILAHFSKHTDPTYYQAISTNANDMTAFGAAVDLDSQLLSDEYSYANLYEITDGIFNFHRSNSDATTYTLHYTKSTDNGTTWAADTKLVSEPNNRSYFKMCKNGANRIDLLVTDGHPNEFATNSVYHFYYDAGTWKTTNGSAIVGSLPYQPSAKLTRIWDGSTAAGNGWCWGITPDLTGKPVAVYAVFPSITDHRYRYAKWSGSTWVDNQICTAGGSLYADGDGQDQYSGGICIDPDDVNTIYCSREVLSSGAIGRGGTHQLFKGVTADGGVTWTMTQLTSGTRKCFRPHKVAGTTKLLYVTGEYHTYLKYQTVIAVMDV